MHKALSEKESFTEKINKKFVNNGLQIPLVFEYENTDSTNTRAKLFAENCECEKKSHAIFFSRAQSAGRGTRMRSFESPEGAGVYISFLLYTDESCTDALHLTSYAACAVCRTVEKISDGKLSPKIKWVNDITVNDKKLSGILTEGKIEDGRTKYAIVGIGVNLSDGAHSDEVKRIMTSLSSHGINISQDDFAIALAEEFFKSLPLAGSDEIMNEYKSRSSVIGRAVNITDKDGTRVELVTDISSDGRLITVDKDKNTREYISGDVSVRHG